MNEKKIWDFLKSKGLNDFGIAGLMGNLKAESNLKPTNLQNTYERKFGLSDEEYTRKVDNGEYTNFVKDSGGYGLAQWTYWSRKQNLLNYAKSQNKSIGDLDMQLNFLIQELQGYGLLDDLQNAKSIREASDKILLQFERPADQSESVQIKRTSFGQEYYNKYATKEVKPNVSSNKKMTNVELVDTLKKLVNTKTIYALGMWGQPISESIIQSKKKQLPKWYTEAKVNELRKYIGKAFGFDCVCMIKSILWGFNFDMNATNGGAKYASNGVPDIGADGMIASGCSIVSSDFSNIEVGSVVWIKGHVGIYIGNKQVIECTPKWSNNVQISNLGNLGNKTGHYRNWSKWGKLKYIEYIEVEDKKEEVKPTPQPTKPTTKFKLGDTVIYKGNVHYTSSNSTNPKPCKGGKATITSTYNGKHPYHLVRVQGGGATVYGWVDEKDIESIGQKEEETYKIHKVVKGDTLWGIAKKYLGNGAKYTEIMKLNNLKSTTIYTGMELKIPR